MENFIRSCKTAQDRLKADMLVSYKKVKDGDVVGMLEKASSIDVALQKKALGVVDLSKTFKKEFKLYKGLDGVGWGLVFSAISGHIRQSFGTMLVEFEEAVTAEETFLKTVLFR